MSPYVLLFFGALVVLSAISAIPGVAALVLIVTFGLGLPLLLSSTTLLYSLSALPFYLWLRSTERRWRLLPLALLPVPIVAFALPIASQIQQDAYVAAQMAQDVVPGGTLSKPSVIEFVDTRTHGRLKGSVEQNVPCDDNCLNLLFNGDVSKVRMTRSITLKTVSLTYQLDRRDQCPVPGRRVPDWILKKMADGTCLVFSESDSSPSEIRITVRQSQDLGGTFLFRPVNLSQLVIERLAGDSAVVVLRKTQVMVQRLATPLFIWYEFREGFPAGLSLSRVESTHGTVHPDMALRTFDGYFGYPPR